MASVTTRHPSDEEDELNEELGANERDTKTNPHGAPSPPPCQVFLLTYFTRLRALSAYLSFLAGAHSDLIT